MSAREPADLHRLHFAGEESRVLHGEIGALRDEIYRFIGESSSDEHDHVADSLKGALRHLDRLDFLLGCDR